MTPPRGKCHFCLQDVLESQQAAYPIRGWELEREQGGANRILGREREPNVIAHATCAEVHVKRGAQTSMEI